MSNRPEEYPTNETILIDSVSSKNHTEQDGVSLLHTERVCLKGDLLDD